MGKEKKKNLGIKTSRYFTKHCAKCGSEYPNWFTNCPSCGTSWDENLKELGKAQESFKKTIKILVKITKEDFNEPISNVKLIFSADRGKSWYETGMDFKTDHFIAEIMDVPVGSLIIYYIEVDLANGEKYIENNDGKYFNYKVGSLAGETEESPPESDSKIFQENLENITSPPQEYKVPEKTIPNDQSQENDNITIFGKPQTQIDPDLRVCPHCNSKIKKMWSACPFCGGKI
jgi:hypothetical protein